MTSIRVLGEREVFTKQRAMGGGIPGKKSTVNNTKHPTSPSSQWGPDKHCAGAAWKRKRNRFTRISIWQEYERAIVGWQKIRLVK